MRSRTQFSVVASLLSAVLAVGTVQAVGAATGTPVDGDVTPPKLVTQPWADFVVGSQITTQVYGDRTDPEGGPWSSSRVVRRFNWSASDPSGVCASSVTTYAVHPEPGSDTGDRTIGFTSDPALRSWTFTASDEDYGGSGYWASRYAEWRATVEDCKVNGAYARIQGAWPTFTQEDGKVSWENSNPVSISYAGSWGTSTCTCWSDSYTRRTSAAGASATITRVFPAGGRIALVMETAPNRGKFDVYVDGVKKATIDTYASAARHRVVVWNGVIATAGSHTVKIVNLATSGRPRIDLDAILTN